MAVAAASAAAASRTLLRPSSRCLNGASGSSTKTSNAAVIGSSSSLISQRGFKCSGPTKQCCSSWSSSSSHRHYSRYHYSHYRSIVQKGRNVALAPALAPALASSAVTTTTTTTTTTRLARRYASTASTEPHQKDDTDKTVTGAPAGQKQVRFTSEAYPDLKRDERFGKLTAEHAAALASIVSDSPSAVIDNVTKPSESIADDLALYNCDWMKKYRGHTQLVLRPSSTDQVSQIMRYCNEHSLAVVPQGGNTGLVGGSVPVFDEIVLNLGRMNQVRSFDDVSGILVADAGLILENADNYLKERGHIFPLDLGAKGSCQIGGNVATNAGGLRLLRYGSLHGNVLGLEMVLPDGTIVDDLSKLRKNNTGYDLKQLFIGGEGTLGVITAVSILCPQRSPAVNVAFFGVESFDKVQQAFREAKGQLGEILSAFELMDTFSQDLVAQVTGNRHPLDGKYPFYVLIETSGSNGEHDAEKLAAFLEDIMEKELVADGTQAQNDSQAAEFWAWREGIAEALGHLGGVYKYDVSLPIAEMYQLVEDTRVRLQEQGLLAPEGEDKDSKSDKYPVIDVVGYGHMGDANLHLNIATRRFDKRVEAAVEPWVYAWIQKRQGSISAEHGLGVAKRPYIGYSRNEVSLGLMRQIKHLFDPKGIMNPYKYI